MPIYLLKVVELAGWSSEAFGIRTPTTNRWGSLLPENRKTLSTNRIE
jgi:hypothetical protein